MTTMPFPAALTSSAACTYDAWNRLVKVVCNPLTVEYRYDGRHRMIARVHEVGETLGRSDYYHNESAGLRSLGGAGWQVVEERRASVTSETKETPVTTVKMQWLCSGPATFGRGLFGSFLVVLRRREGRLTTEPWLDRSGRGGRRLG